MRQWCFGIRNHLDRLDGCTQEIFSCKIALQLWFPKKLHLYIIIKQSWSKNYHWQSVPYQHVWINSVPSPKNESRLLNPRAYAETFKAHRRLEICSVIGVHIAPGCFLTLPTFCCYANRTFRKKFLRGGLKSRPKNFLTSSALHFIFGLQFRFKRMQTNFYDRP